MVNESVLVLNRSWIAVNVASARRAISLLYQGYAKVVSPEDFSTYDFDDWRELSQAADDYCIHAVNFKIRIPDVIVLTVFNGIHRRDIKFSRRNIFERDRNTCQYCGNKFKKWELTLDHVVPRSIGGRSTWENLVLACIPCNVRKGNRLPEEAAMPLIRKPRKPRWIPYSTESFASARKPSWQRFVDAAYWDVELKD
ncbi:MAG: HNH endonuclease [Candidatus Abyssobacteria bacterium SURF_5]|uniref:HNH endonuclease n=1 Tax=Abyssobacteria bacterium (strain SURF_5) TaxID=2093360 RepID=A0A3A4NX85_ABYX5|nr:MAG: HNH endonuclease [Candidatus Abyssubacteria bacterium SURF_5]